MPEKISLRKDQQSQTAAQRTMMTDVQIGQQPTGHLKDTCHGSQSCSHKLEHLKPSGHHTFPKIPQETCDPAEELRASQWELLEGSRHPVEKG